MASYEALTSLVLGLSLTFRSWFGCWGPGSLVGLVSA